MIRSVFELFSFLLKLLGRIILYIFKGVSWYFGEVLKIFDDYPKSKKKKIIIKGEVL